MVVSDITGGMGNQMFQYACGYALAKENDDIFGLDISHLDSEYQKKNNILVPRKYELDKYKITAPILSFSAPSGGKVDRLINRILKFHYMGSLIHTKFVRDTSPWTYNPRDITYKKNIYLCGFWQSWKYFDKYRNDIMQEFDVKNEYISEKCTQIINEDKKKIGIHIRRGDYKNCDGWLIDPKFYTDSLKKLEECIDGEYDIYVFCNEEGFAEKLFGELNTKGRIRYISASKEYSDFEEFLILKSCSYFIISNSSYSWWAAYLNGNDSEIVIAPEFKQWGSDFYPSEWVRIKVD